MGGCVLKTAWQEHYQRLPRSSFGWHDCSRCSSFCLAGTMPEAFLTFLDRTVDAETVLRGCVLKICREGHWLRCVQRRFSFLVGSARQKRLEMLKVAVGVRKR